MPEEIRTMSHDLLSKIDTFKAAKTDLNDAQIKADAADLAEKAASVAAKAAHAALDEAKHAAYVAKNDLDAAFLQEVDPMPLVPQARPMTVISDLVICGQIWTNRCKLERIA